MDQESGVTSVPEEPVAPHGDEHLGTRMNGGPRQARARVGLFTLGGTIAMTAEGAAGAVPRLGASDLAAAVPGLAATGISVEVRDVRSLPSASLTWSDVLAVRAEIEACLAVGAIDDAVVTQGTDTIEETSWLLDLLHTGDAPVVVTGAMRAASLAGADGPANLLAAVQVAAAPVARGLGVLVAFGDDVHSARAVRKTHSTSITAFTSPNSGPIGHVSEGEVRIWARPRRRALPAASPALRPGALERPRIAVVPMAFALHDAVLRAVLECVDGLVVAAFGLGHVPAALVEVLAEAAERMPVVLASRTPAGPVGTRSYAYPGSESDLLGRGLLRAGYLDPYRARILLQVLLAADAGRAEIRRAFADLGED